MDVLLDILLHEDLTPFVSGINFFQLVCSEVIIRHVALIPVSIGAHS